LKWLRANGGQAIGGQTPLRGVSKMVWMKNMTKLFQIIRAAFDMDVQPATIYLEAYSTLSRISAELDNPKKDLDMRSYYGKDE